MTIPLFGEYKKIAPKWYHILESNNICENGEGVSIGGYDRCFVGEIYLFDSIKYNSCQSCKDFALIFYYLITRIPRKLSIGKWDEPVEQWEDKLPYALNRLKEDSGEDKICDAIEKMFNYYRNNIDIYRDLFNCFANNYLQHLSQCETYVENVAIVSR